MTTANEIIKGAFRIAGITVTGESPSAGETQDALSTLNDLMESLSNDSLFVFARQTESFILSPNITEYTIGTGGDLNTTRPIDIVSAYVRLSNVDYDVSVISDEQYADITLKSVSSIPYFLNYTASFPLGTVKIYPAPSTAYTLFLLSEKPLSTFTLNETVTLPPGWSRFLKNQLAIEISSEYGQQIPPAAVQNAAEAKGMIKRGAAKVKSLDAFTAGNRGNIYSGWENG